MREEDEWENQDKFRYIQANFEMISNERISDDDSETKQDINYANENVELDKLVSNAA
jgi:hypothetical protein